MLKHTLSTCVALLFCGNALAISSFNATRMPEQGRWHTGIEINTLFERKLENGYTSFRTTQYLWTASVGLTDWFSLDGAVGFGDIRLQDGALNEIDFNGGFAGKYGFRVKLFEREDCPYKLVTGFQHVSVHPDNEIVGGVSRQVIFDDWQWSLMGSMRVSDKLEPYIGVKFSEGDIIEWQDKVRKRHKSENAEAFGLIVGMLYDFDSTGFVTIEGRLFDEDALSVGYTYQF
jgi:hypothetical protein